MWAMEQKRLHPVIERTFPETLSDLRQTVEEITPGVSLNHSSSRNGSDCRSRSNSSRRDKPGGRLPTSGINGKARFRRCF